MPTKTITDCKARTTIGAMQTENILKAGRRGTVKKIVGKPGQSLAVDELIMEFEG